MSTSPLVSILIPAFNAQEWIGDSIRSALNQTWRRKEIIVVDDGSRDNTLRVARQFTSAGVWVFTQENRGASSARNRAFSLCQGDYIQWLDADDLLAPDKVTQQMRVAQALANRRVLLSGAWGKFIYQVGQATFSPTSLWNNLTPIEYLLRKLGEGVFMQTCSWLVSRELCEAAGPWDTRLLSDDDGEYFCRVALASEGVRFVPTAKSFYRETPSTRRLSYIGASDKKKDALFLSMQLHLRYICSLEESDRVRAACLAYLQTWLINFYPERSDLVREVQGIARELGGSLTTPRLRWKYAWIKPLFGWQAAKAAQMVLPEFKASLRRFVLTRKP